MGIRVTKTALEGVLIIDTDFSRDDRGFFLESYHRQRFVEHGVSEVFVQDNHSRSSARVLRGFHYQDMTAPMVKLIRCTVGRILDVAVDLRVGSPTFARTVAVELGPDTMRQLLVPVGFGHAFLTLSEVAEVQYKCSNYYAPATEGGVSWNDPDIDIVWPITDPLLSARDRSSMSLKQYLEKPAFVYGQRP
jgi:dTDP-4-dehydrorhamnose 3,5-epimerase